MKKLGLHDILETERCIIKIAQESDAEYMWSLITEGTTKYMIWDKGEDCSATLQSIKKAREDAKNKLKWEGTVYLKDSGICIGRCGINEIKDKIPSFQLGYWISEEYYGKGIIPECVKRYLKFAFEESSFEKGVLKCDSNNINSEKVALKCGYSFEGLHKNDDRINGKLRDSKYFGISREDYLGKKK